MTTNPAVAARIADFTAYMADVLGHQPAVGELANEAEDERYALFKNNQPAPGTADHITWLALSFIMFDSDY